MGYFSTIKLFLTPSFDLEAEEQEKLIKYLVFLDNSNVGKIISRYVKNTSQLGGRPSVNYYRLFATIVYGFAFDKCTLRELEKACKYDLRYIALMEQTQVNYTTFCKFINKVIVPNENEIFMLINLQIKKELNISFDDAFIDGTKFEANANKYKFVWKPITFHKRLSLNANQIINSLHMFSNYKNEELNRSATIAEALSRLQTNKSNYGEIMYNESYKALFAMLTKVLDYEEKETICGSNRNSYYKTDRDATAMCLKGDYYSGLGSNLHAAYNTQALVIRGFVFAYFVSQSRADINDFIPILDSFYTNYHEYPKNVCADAGYGSFENYEYLSKNGMNNYVKYQTWEGNVNGSRPDCYALNNDETITCLNGNVGVEVPNNNRHPKNANAVFYRVEGCEMCNFSPYCKRFLTKIDENFKVFEINKQYQKYKQQATINLLSKKGIEIRVNRSIEVEGVFGIEKQDHGLSRFRRRGLEKVTTETMLNFIGLNIAKLFKYYNTNRLDRFWVAPDDLKDAKLKKPSWKILSKKGKKLNEKIKASNANKK